MVTVAAGTRLGPYDIVGLLGAGGMGEVYRARDPRLGREVAIKVLPSEVAADSARLALFEREARAVAALNHPNILTVHDVGTHEGTPYVVTELLEGETLRELVSRRVPTTPQILSYMLQAARGLEAAHAKGIVHRDLKPENLFLTTDGRVKVLDFGLAKLVRADVDVTSEASTAAHSTPPGQVAGTILYMSPEQARAQPIEVRSDVFSFGVVLYELLAGKHPFRKDTVAGTLTAIVEETPPALESLGRGVAPAVAGVVRRCLGKIREDRYASGHDVVVALEAVLAAPSGAAALGEVEERSPYPGLSSFTEKDASVFFGREREVEELWRRIPNRRLLAVIGPSGAGKTSFVRAGVLPARPEGWRVIVCGPGAHPFRALGQALGPELAGDAESLGKLVGLDDPDTAVELFGRWRGQHGEALLVVDQFEELLTLNPPEIQERFASLLGRLTSEAGVHVLLSLRDDFLVRCCEHKPLAPAVESLTVLLALGPEDLRRAIEEPARKRGYRFEDDALVAEMVQAVEGARAALPLLAFAVSRLWEKRDRETKVLTRAAYEETGGVAGALAQHAEATMERVGVEHHDLVRGIFRNLTTAQGTRAVMDRKELLSAFADRDAAESVLAQLVDARLLTSYEVEDLDRRSERAVAGAPASHSERAIVEDRAKDLSVGTPNHHRIEIAHESLLKAWPRLVRWQTQDEDGAQLRDQLKQAAHLWEDRGRTPDVLWSGSALKEYELWRERYSGNLTALEESFAGAMLERERRRRTWRRAGFTTLVAGLIFVAAVVSVSRHQAVQQAERADQEARRAEASKLVALAELRLEDDPTEALALATASLELADTQEARLFVVRALAEGPPAREVSAGAQVARIPAFSPTGRWLAAIGHATEAKVWSDTGEGPVVLPGHEPSSRCALGAWWPDEGHIVTGLGCGLTERVYVWSWPSGAKVRTIELGAPSFYKAVRGGRLIAVTPVGADGPEHNALLLRSWTLPDGEGTVLGQVPYPVASDPRLDLVASEPNGRGWMFARGRDVHFQPLPLEAGARPRLMSRHEGTVDELWEWGDRLLVRDVSGKWRIWSFPADGPKLDREVRRPENLPEGIIADAEPSGRWVFALEDRRVRLWDLTAPPGARPLELRRRGSWANGWVDFHPAGRWIVAGTHQISRLTFWPLAGPRPLVVDGYGGRRQVLSFSPDSRWVAAASWRGQLGLRLWPVPGNDGEVRILAAEGAVAVAFDPRGRYLVKYGGGTRVIPLDGSPERELQNANDEGSINYRLAVSPRGHRVATAFVYGTGARNLRVWDVETGELRLLPLPPTASSAIDPVRRGAVTDLHFVDESTLFTAGDGGIRRWDVDAGTHEVVWPPEPEEIIGMSMSADGKVAITGASYLMGCRPAVLHDLTADEHREVLEYGSCVKAEAIDPSGRVVATGDQDGVVRVGRFSGGAPHLLYGHEGPVNEIGLSPDGRWVASIAEDETLRVWPMPDLDNPPLHALPHDELVAKLRSLTNIRAVRDSEAPTGWTIELGPFPGWQEIPTW